MSINKTSNNQKIKKLDESPTIADIVSIELLTPGSDECFISNPYKVDKVTIYSLGRNHFSGTPFIFEENHLNSKVLAEYEKAKAIACAYSHATGTVTITDAANLVATTHYITIATTDGTTITATVTENGGTTTTTDTNSPTWALVSGSESSTAANLATCLNANSKLTAVANGGVVTITQVDAGEAGNTTIVLTDPDAVGMSKTDFAGGLPTKAQLKEVERLKSELNDTTNKSSNYYSELVPVKVLGDENNPAWLSTDTDNAFIENVPLDADGNNQFGNFKYNWNPVQSREGDYIVCWTWTPNAAGDSISSYLKFNLEGSTVLTTSIPAHFTNPEKYTTLLERYLPEVYKSKLSAADVTPDTLDKFHKAIAKGFTFVEDMANQSVDLLDANSTHESLLNLLSNMFNLRLKSDDPTLWRRQIKTAVPLFKRKGTSGSLKESFLQADMELKKVTKLWQITSPYTWQESFKTDAIANKSSGTVVIQAVENLAGSGSSGSSPTHYIAITTTDGTVITATATSNGVATTTTNTNSPTWAIVDGSNYSTAANLAICLNANSKLTATASNESVTITQVSAGEAGDTTIVLTDPGEVGMSKTDFTGGLPMFVLEKVALGHISDGAIAATATVTITDFTELNSTDKVNLIATDGTNYDFVNGDQDSAFGTWESDASNNQTAANLATVINTSSGPSGTRFSASAVGAVVTITQSTSGTYGNTTATLTDSGTGGMSKTDFTGGVDDPLAATATVTITDYTELNSGDAVNLIATDGTNYDFINGSQSSTSGTWEADASNNQTATNLAAVINTSSGPSGSRFSASAVGAVVTISQSTSGADGNSTVTLADSGTGGMTKTNFTGGSTANTSIFRRPKGSSSYTELTDDHVSFSTSEGETTMTWVGHLLSSSPITLSEGDFVKILYEVINVPSSTEQVKENYIRSLPLADQRDEDLQDYPPKNWNVRLIEEDDALFDVLIPDRHPFHDPVLYGKIRTEFPYSENIYNMEEYNGSLRDSTDPCHLDKYFVDKCQYCQSSKFNLDLEIKDLSTDRIDEAESIIKEYTPFHSVLHQVNVSGGFNEFVLSPIENLEGTVKYSITENVLSGNQQKVFFRAMFDNAFTSSTQATGTVTITDYTELNSTDKVNLIASDGTNYDFVNGSQSSVNGTWESDTSNDQTATNLMNVINTSSGPSGTRFTATAEGAVVTIAQSTFGPDGNTTITLTDSGTAGMSKTDFVNGSPTTSSGFVKRNMLAFSTTEVSSQSATGFNDNIVIYAPDVRFDLLPLDTSSNVLKILSPSANAGNYSIASPDTHMANISGITEPLNTSSFAFRLSNDSYSGTAAIEQDDVFAFSDTTVDFIEKGIKTDWDDNNDSSYTGTAWKVQITEAGFLNGIYTISNILSDGSLILNDPTEALPKSNSSSLSYNILDDSNNHVSSSDNGSLAISRRAKITDSSPSGGGANDIRDVADTSDYFVLSGTEYKIIGFVDSQDYQFYISGYTAGDASGQSFNVYKRLVDSEAGYLDYRGMKIVTSSNHETGLGIVNGSNPPAIVVDDNLFKENFLVLIGSNYYKVTGIDGTTINVDGPEESWKVSGGTSVTYSILKYSKENISIQPKAGYGGETEGYSGETVDGLSYVQPTMYQYLGHDFNFIDRRGNEVISLNTDTAAPFAAFAAEALNANDDQIKEPISQEENITLEIEWADDEEIEGDNI